jgi:hypothetical protein
MRHACGITMALVLALSTLAQAQTYVTGGGVAAPMVPPAYYQSYPYTHASTFQEGVARGVGDVIRSAGEYNLATSAAAVNWTDARKRQIESDLQWLKTYYEFKDIKAQARAAELARQRVSPEEMVRFAQAGKPRPLSPRELDAATGKIRWPILLNSEEFAAGRNQVQKVFEDRAYHGVIGAAEFVRVSHLADQMLADLKSQIRSVPADQYVEARRFLVSLAYEAGQPAG